MSDLGPAARPKSLPLESHEARSAVEVFWIVTEWPNGALAITFPAIAVILLAPRADAAYAQAVRLTIGTALPLEIA
jgi:Fusaric acid resistance protein family